MQILVKLNGDIDDWAIIYLQGELNSREQTITESKFIGDLFFQQKGNSAVPVLIIGHHILYGNCQQLKKPLAVLQKSANESSDKCHYEVRAIVKKMLTFRTRPKSVMTKPATLEV